MRKSLNRYIPICSANQMITYLISRGLSDAQINGSPAVRTGNLQAYLLDAVEQAYQEAVQSVSILKRSRLTFHLVAVTGFAPAKISGLS